MLARKVESLGLDQTSLNTLKAAGFETLADLDGLTTDQLAEETKLPTFLCEQILKEKTSPNLPSTSTQSVSKLLSASERGLLHSFEPVDELLNLESTSLIEGTQGIHASSSQGTSPNSSTTRGLKPGHILEISGPPGSPKEQIMLELVKSATGSGQRVIFLDVQNMTTPFNLKRYLRGSSDALELVKYIRCESLSQFMIFMRNLDTLIPNEKANVLVLNTFSSLFQSTQMSNQARSALLEEIKQLLAQICAATNLTIVIVSQMSTKLLDSEGASSNFASATSAMMVPQLGFSYLPRSRSIRISAIPDSPTSGYVRVLETPALSADKLKGSVIAKPYELDQEMLRSPSSNSYTTLYSSPLS